ALEHGRSGAQPIEDNVPHIAAQPIVGDTERIEHELRGDLLPESAQLFKPCFGCVARDERTVDGADRNSCDPIGMQVCLGKRLIHASLKGAECTAPLQNQGNAVERRPRQPSVALEKRVDESRLMSRDDVVDRSATSTGELSRLAVSGATRAGALVGVMRKRSSFLQTCGAATFQSLNPRSKCLSMRAASRPICRQT